MTEIVHVLVPELTTIVHIAEPAAIVVNAGHNGCNGSGGCGICIGCPMGGVYTASDIRADLQRVKNSTALIPALL